MYIINNFIFIGNIFVLNIIYIYKSILNEFYVHYNMYFLLIVTVLLVVNYEFYFLSIVTDLLVIN